MDTAYCTKDGKPWDADELRKIAAKSPKQWLADRRQHFICRGCDEKARFVNPASNNRVAHFGVVFQHDIECDFLGDPTGGLKNTDPATPVPAQYNMGGNKEVRYDTPGPLVVQASAPGAGNAGGKSAAGGGVVHSQPATNAPNAHQTTGLSRLLGNLRNGDDYPPLNLFLDVPGRGTAVRAADYFYRIKDIDAQTGADGMKYAFWGKISSAYDGKDSNAKEILWINCDNVGSIVSIRLDPVATKDLYKALGLTRDYELNQAHLIVEGVLKQGAHKLTIPVTDIRKMAFRPKR